MSLYRKPPRLPELLAPAGSPEALEAAIAAGADAVYLGGSRFNARMTAAYNRNIKLACIITFNCQKNPLLDYLLSIFCCLISLPKNFLASYEPISLEEILGE